MARQIGAPVTRESGFETTLAEGIDPEERQRMTQEAAYYRYVERGYAPGHDLDDWLAAEAGLDIVGRNQQPIEAVAMPEFEVQQSGMHSFREDEALKRVVRQHPQRDISRAEGIEPQEAPPKQ